LGSSSSGGASFAAAPAPLVSASQRTVDALTCGAFRSGPRGLRPELCPRTADLTQRRPKWETQGIAWQSYLCGPASARLLGYRPLDPLAATLLAPLLSELKLDTEIVSRATLAGAGAGAVSGSDGRGAAEVLGPVAAPVALGSCLQGRRLFVIGDSWARQLFLNLVDVVQPSNGIKSRRTPYFNGGQSLSKERHCKFGGAGAGVDFKCVRDP